VSLLIRLYPAQWRERYGEEFAALLEERPLGPFDVADIVLGAIDARLHLQRDAPSQARKGFTMSLRLGGIAAILAGILWLAGMTWSGLDPADQDPGILLALAGMVLLLVALVELSAFQARTQPRLVWAAFAVPAVGTVLTIIGMVGMAIVPDRPFIAQVSGWEVFIVGLFAALVGSSLFGLATYRAAVLSRAGSLVLAAAAPLALLTILGTIGASGSALSAAIGIITLAAWSAGWVLLGWAAVRLDGTLPRALPA
jgi:hypothetical protein